MREEAKHTEALWSNTSSELSSEVASVLTFASAKMHDAATIVQAHSPSVQLAGPHWASLSGSLMRTLTQIVSNFQLASQSFENDPMRITLVIQLSFSRIHQLEDLAKAWRGPISAALLVEQKSDWKKVAAYFKQTLHTKQFVDIHLVASSFALVDEPAMLHSIFLICPSEAQQVLVSHQSDEEYCHQIRQRQAPFS